MGVWSRAAREWRFLRGLYSTLRRVSSISADSDWLTCDDIEAAVDRRRNFPAIVFEGRTVTYGEFDALANRYANWAKGRGIKRGEVIALFMPNRIEYLAVWYGLSKVGIATALINNQLTGPALAHSLNICGAVHLIADAETWPVFEAVREQLTRSMTEWIVGGLPAGARVDRDLDRTIKGVSALRPERSTARAGLTAKDVALYVYTSGTTGMPKAAKITHMRAQLYMRGFWAASETTPADRVYNCLPLYHATGGLCAVGAALLGGGVLLLKRKFSAASFWDDVVGERATVFFYIGELCRYLVNQPERQEERQHKLRLAVGNGLSAEVWQQMQIRFKIPRILEFYGATEGNVSLVNIDGRRGAVGRVPKYLRKRFNVRIVRFDPETQEVVRGANGLAIECRPGEIGEVIGAIGADARFSYAGYADKAATNAKILRDAFTKGDAWFRTGDLMRQDGDGYFYFVDRVGDTFRWKGENVSSSEVTAHVLAAPGVKDADVYGVEVQGQEGRAGMAALVIDEEFTLEAFAAHIDATLPVYARPVFVRILPELATTATFKRRKVELIAEGFNPSKTDQPLYVRERDGGYQPIDRPRYARIQGGKVRI